jgi:hypothetical protein
MKHKHEYIYQITVDAFTHRARSIYLCKKCGKRKDVKAGDKP